MLYEELRDILIDYMNNGAILNLHSLLNTLIDCEDINYIVLYTSLEDLRMTNKENCNIIANNTKYMTGYIRDKNSDFIYNNAGLRIYDKEDIQMDVIWFGRYDLLSNEKNCDRYGNPLQEFDIKLTDDINIIGFIADRTTRIDKKVLFGDEYNA